MKNINEIQKLKQKLLALNQDVAERIVHELVRIGRPVPLPNEIKLIDQESLDIQLLSLTELSEPVINTTDISKPEKHLKDYILSGQVRHSNLINVLNFLKSLVGQDSILIPRVIPIEPEDMRYHENLDYWICSCGNFEKEEGFNACDSDGNLIPPRIHPTAESLCRCERCGRIIEILNHRIVGITIYPH